MLQAWSPGARGRGVQDVTCDVSFVFLPVRLSAERVYLRKRRLEAAYRWVGAHGTLLSLV